MSDGVFVQFVSQFFYLYGNPDKGLPEVSLYCLCS